MKKSDKPKSFRTLKDKKHVKVEETLSVDELKNYIKECEDKYHDAFNSESCNAIMTAYYEWQNAKKRYYTAIGVCKPKDDIPKDILENDEIISDFNSLI